MTQKHMTNTSSPTLCMTGTHRQLLPKLTDCNTSSSKSAQQNWYNTEMQKDASYVDMSVGTRCNALPSVYSRLYTSWEHHRLLHVKPDLQRSQIVADHHEPEQKSSKLYLRAGCCFSQIHTAHSVSPCSNAGICNPCHIFYGPNSQTVKLLHCKLLANGVTAST